MKKINKVLSVSALFTLLAISFTACFNPVLYQINQDVVSEKAIVSGSINSITRYTVGGQEYIVIAAGEESNSANKGLLYKKVESDKEAESNKYGQWKAYPVDNLPFENGLHHYDYYGEQNHLGEQIIKVLAGSEYLYVVTVTYKNNSTLGTNSPDKVKIWATKIADWETSSKADWTNIIADETAARGDGVKICPTYEDNKYTYSAFNIFSTNAPIANNRKVYLRSGNNKEFTAKYFELDGLNLVEKTNLQFLTLKDSEYITANTSSSTELINTVASVNGSEIFFSTKTGVTTNETYSKNATIWYAGADDRVAYGTSYSDPKNTVKVGTKIASLAYCKDVLLIGCGNTDSYLATSDAGIEKVNLNNDIPEDRLGSFDTNAQSQLLSSYIVLTLLNATPEKTELESTLYASVNFVGTATSTQANFKNIGLWSYYSKRGNWNKE